VTDERYSPAVLRNRGVAVTLACTRCEEEVVGGVVKRTWHPCYAPGPDGVEMLQTEIVYVRFDMNALADLEEQFGSMQDWLNGLQPPLESFVAPDGTERQRVKDGVQWRPTSHLRRTFALLLGRDLRDVGTALIADQEHTAMYYKALTVGWGLANGVDPQKAAEVMSKSIDEVLELGAGEPPSPS
jgi:hypothetical protein